MVVALTFNESFDDFNDFLLLVAREFADPFEHSTGFADGAATATLAVFSAKQVISVDIEDGCQLGEVLWL